MNNEVKFIMSYGGLFINKKQMISSSQSHYIFVIELNLLSNNNMCFLISIYLLINKLLIFHI